MSVTIGSPQPTGKPPKQVKKLKPLTIDSLKRKAKREYKKAIENKDEEAATEWKKVIEAKRINISEDGSFQVAIEGPKHTCWKCEQENYPLEDVGKFWGYECSCGTRDTKVKDNSEKLDKYFGTGY